MSKPVNEPTTRQVIGTLFGGVLFLAGLIVMGYFGARDRSTVAFIFGALMLGVGSILVFAEKPTPRKLFGTILLVAGPAAFFGYIMIFGTDFKGPEPYILFPSWIFCMLAAVFLLANGEDEAQKRARETANKARETATDALCEHLKRMGLDATVESRERKSAAGFWIMGSVKVANRNIDSMEMEWQVKSVGPDEGPHDEDFYRCSYVVRAKVEGLEDKLKAHTKLVRKGFLFRVVDFKWKGKELAQVLNSDADVKRTLHPLIVGYRGHSGYRPSVEVKPYRKHQCVRIRPHPPTGAYAPSYSPTNAFPTIETFEAFDRIAQHIRTIANVHP